MSNNSPVSVTHEDSIAWVVIDNPPVNATSQAVRQGLMDAVAEVAGRQFAVLMCAGRTFVAGGDMSEFDGPALEPHLPNVVQAIEDSDVPFLAVMHGNVLGGGLEIAMGCAWRIAAVGTKFGLPEVNVGLVPGAGGTQRAPRLFGMKIAIEMAAAGKIEEAANLVPVGGLDRVFEGEPKDAARAFLADVGTRPVPVSQRHVLPASPETLKEQYNRIAKRARGQKSPLLNLEALGWAYLPFATGQARERELHLELRHSGECRAMRYAFFAEREVARPKAVEGATPRPLASIAVVGGGLMGSGIATAALLAGLAVTLIERKDVVTEAAHGRVSGLIDEAVKRGKINSETAAEHLARFRASHDYSDATGADLAIEAVFEDLQVKKEVFHRLANAIGPEAILATNTSYIDPREIFAGIPNATRCIGLHFFSPAHVMKLLEIVPLTGTSKEVLATGFSFGKQLRKVSVLAGICDGFIGNRMLAEYRRVAEYLLADGALPQEVDAAARAFGFPMGPWELQDLTGLQIAWANRKRQAAIRPAQERYVTISDQLCDMNRLGQLSGSGWYDYVEGDRTPRPSAVVEKVIRDFSDTQGITRRAFGEDEIKSRILAVLANEGARIVEEGIAGSDSTVDMVQLHGYAFPRWLGGPMHAAAQIGWDSIADTMKTIAAESPNSWVLSTRAARAG